MFRRIEINNFKSLVDVEVELGLFTVLVGNNGSGKSSFLQAIDLASWAVKYESINSALKEHHVEYADLVHLGSAVKQIGFEADLIVPDQSSSKESEVVRFGIVFSKRRYVYLKGEFGESLQEGESPFVIGSRRRQRFAVEGDQFIHRQNVAIGRSMLHDIYHAQNADTRFPVLYQVARHFVHYAHYEIWGPDALRQSSQAQQQYLFADSNFGALGKRGEGLPHMLRSIQKSPNRWGKLRRELKEFYPGVQHIHFRRGLKPGELGLMFEEKATGKPKGVRYRPSQMSDGFMRMLALLTIKHQPEPLMLLGYEEPENGLHPSALLECMRHLKEIAQRGTQVIVTTHSPYLLNHLLEDETEPRAQLRLVMRNRAGKTTIAEPDPKKIERARRQGYGIGELWGMLLDEKELT